MQEKLSPSMFIGVQGDGIISFGSGQPDLPPPERVFKILPNYRQFKYGLVQGQENLRTAISKKEGFEGASKDNFIITNGASEALDLTFRAVCNAGDKILVHQPYYYAYVPLIKMNHFEPVLTETISGKIELEDFDKKVRGCKAVLINSPSNPTGRIQDMNTLKQIEKLCADLNITIISDEVYKDLIYERQNYMLKGPHVITINSFSKTFAMCGLRVGYMYSNDMALIEKAVEIKNYSSMNTSILSQEMALEALKAPADYISNQVKIWKERRDVIFEGLQKLGLELWKPEGAFYVLPKINNPKDAVLTLFKKYRVITYLGDWFGASGRIRLSYALDVEKIDEGLKRIKKYLEDKREN